MPTSYCTRGRHVRECDLTYEGHAHMSLAELATWIDQNGGREEALHAYRVAESAQFVWRIETWCGRDGKPFVLSLRTPKITSGGRPNVTTALRKIMAWAKEFGVYEFVGARADAVSQPHVGGAKAAPVKGIV